MKSFSIAIVAILSLLATAVQADTNIVSENFDSYSSQSEFEAVWRPDLGSGYDPSGSSNGFLVPNTNLGLTPPNDDPPGIQGQGINISTGINEWDNDSDSNNVPFQLVPSATQAIRVSGDFFSDTIGNKRVSLGLRNDTVQREFGVYGYNFLELGQYNAATTDPTTGDPIPDTTSFAYRLALFDSGSIGAPLIQTPNWQYFPLDPILDTKDPSAEPNPDGLVTPTDIGVGWHRYSATITPTTVTLELDLFRDGLKNSEATAGVGVAGVDSSVTWTISPTNIEDDEFDFDPFTSLRIGTPSGISSANESVVDNVSLDLIDIVAPGGDNADFNGDLLVDGEDFLTWQRGNGLSGQTDNSNGDANGNGTIDGDDLAVWNTQYGGAPPAATAILAAVPEPSTAVLGLLLMLGASLPLRTTRKTA